MLRSPKVYNDLGAFWLREEVFRHQWRKYIYPVVEVDERPIIDHSRYGYNLQELLRSKKKPGLYKIIGIDRGFDGYKDPLPAPVIVTHHDTHISWHHTAPGLERIYHFERRQYCTTIERLKVELRDLIRQFHAEVKTSELQILPVTTESYPFIQDLAKQYRIYDYEFNIQS